MSDTLIPSAVKTLEGIDTGGCTGYPTSVHYDGVWNDARVQYNSDKGSVIYLYGEITWGSDCDDGVKPKSYYVYRAYLQFDLSSYSTTVTSATLTLMPSAGGSGNVHVCEFTHTSLGANSDSFLGFDRSSFYGGAVLGGNDVAVTITLTDTAIAYINANLGSTITFVLLHDNDVDDIDPGVYRCILYSSGDNQPSLTLNYAADETTVTETPTWGEDVYLSPAQRYLQGETAVLRTYIGDGDGSTDTPDTCVITIVDPAGTTQVDEASMTETATGVYDYFYDIADDAETGVWKVTFKSTYTDGATTRYVIDNDSFTVE